MVNVWATVREDLTSAPDDILSQPIWHNEKIKIGGNPIFLNRWVKSEVFFINDFVTEEGNFLSFNEFQNRYNIRIIF